MKKKLSNYFRKPFNVCSLIGVAIGIILSYFFADYIGLLTPPSAEDYADLYVQKDQIIDNIDTIFDFNNASILSTDDKIIIELVSTTNSDYSLRLTFSKDKQLIACEERSDKPGFETYTEYRILDSIGLHSAIIFLGILVGLSFACILHLIYKKLHSKKKRC